MSMIRTVLMMAALVVATSAQATTRGMIEVGGGTETGISAPGGWNVLLRVETGARWASEGADIPFINQLILVHVDGEMSVNPSDNGERLPYMNMRFTPLAAEMPVANPDGSGYAIRINMLDTAVHRDTRVGRNYSLKVSVIGVETGFQSLVGDNIQVFLDLAAELIGYKVISQDDSYGTAHAFRVGGASIAAGIAFNINQSFLVKIAVGGSADLNVRGGGSARGIQSDQAIYARISAHITRYLEAFAQIGLMNMSDAGANDQRTIRQFMTGLNVTFM